MPRVSTVSVPDWEEYRRQLGARFVRESPDGRKHLYHSRSYGIWIVISSTSAGNIRVEVHDNEGSCGC